MEKDFQGQMFSFQKLAVISKKETRRQGIPKCHAEVHPCPLIQAPQIQVNPWAHSVFVSAGPTVSLVHAILSA